MIRPARGMRCGRAVVARSRGDPLGDPLGDLALIRQEMTRLFEQLLSQGSGRTQPVEGAWVPALAGRVGVASRPHRRRMTGVSV